MSLDHKATLNSPEHRRQRILLYEAITEPEESSEHKLIRPSQKYPSA